MTGLLRVVRGSLKKQAIEAILILCPHMRVLQRYGIRIPPWYGLS